MPSVEQISTHLPLYSTIQVVNTIFSYGMQLNNNENQDLCTGCEFYDFNNIQCLFKGSCRFIAVYLHI